MAAQALLEQISMANRYPDPTAGDLTEKVALRHDLPARSIVVGNGIDELLLLSALTLIDPQVGGVVCEQTYPGHTNALIAGRGLRGAIPLIRSPSLSAPRVDAQRMIDAMTPGAVVYICNPHNPSGSCLLSESVRALAEAAAVKGATLVMDEAYLEFTNHGETDSAVQLVREGLPVVVLRTFSKIFGLAGLRCGYALAPPSISDELRRMKNVLVFNVNRFALAASTASLQDDGFVEDVRRRTRKTLDEFAGRLAGCSWVQVNPSVTNFVLLELPWPAALVTAELERCRILVRGCHDLGFPTGIRVAAGTDHQMRSVESVLHAIATRSHEMASESFLPL